MLFSENNNSISLDIVDYEFPDSPKSEDGEFNYDSNWLVLSVNYTDKIISVTEKDACLLTYELSELYENLHKLSDAQAGSCISDFMEPVLHIAAVKKEGYYSFNIRFNGMRIKIYPISISSSSG